MKKYDAIIIGSGQAGTPLCKKLAAAGWKTALIERSLVGGTCVNYGCTPTKALVASARMAYQAGRGKEYGIPVSGYKVDMKAIMARKDKIVAHAHHGTEKQLLATEHLDLIYGNASFTGPDTISVALNGGSTQELQAKHIFINTGLHTDIPEIDGIDRVDYLTSTSILDLHSVPKHLVILGGSYIGLEFGQMFRRFGSKVTILDTSPIFLPKEDDDIAAEMRKVLEGEGITIHSGAKAESIKQVKQIALKINVAGKTMHLQCSHLLVAAGRRPNTANLGLAKAGVDLDEKGFIKVNSKLETSVKGIYALGDVKGGPAFTHISYNDHLVVAHNLLQKGKATTKGRPVPYCMFTDPELGRVGLTEREAKEQGLKIKVATLPMSHVARAVETGNTHGLMKAVIDVKSDKIIGVAILGEQGGELMTVLQMAMEGGLTYHQLREMIFAHPTYSESINNLFIPLDKL